MTKRNEQLEKNQLARILKLEEMNLALVALERNIRNAVWSYKMDWEDVKTIEECVEEATMDTYGDWEQASGWLTCIEEIFGNVREVKVMGETVNLKGFDLDGTSVVAVCKKGKMKIRTTLDSIEIIKPTRAQKLWLKAWIKWRADQI